jgi:hypothetical protein
MPGTYSDLSPQLLNQASGVVHNYTTAIVRYTAGTDKKEIAQLVGSGTFVVSGNTFAVLTAGHVVENLKKPFSLGLSVQESEHKYLIDSELLTPRVIARGKDDSAGPDLGIIILPDVAIGWIKASRSFYDLDAGLEYLRNGSCDADIYAAALCGVPDVLKRDQPSERGYTGVRLYTQLCLFGSVGNTYVVDDFDYCDAEINYDSSNTLPESFEGVSGGGLWFVPLREKGRNIIETEKPILHGVAFYQTQRQGSLRAIRCQGPMSIYEQARQAINRNS